jgi:peptidoglycan hydrolase CwlO-like protein
MKTLISALITGLAGGLSASFFSLLLLRRTVARMEKTLNALEKEYTELDESLNEIDTAVGLLDKEIDKIKNRQKD